MSQGWDVSDISKGYEAFRKKNQQSSGGVKQLARQLPDIIKEFPMIQKSAYEAKYAANELELLCNDLYVQVTTLGDIVGGLVNLVISKEVATKEDLDKEILKYSMLREQDYRETQIEKMGFKNKVETVGEECLVLVDLDVIDGESSLESYPKKMFFVTAKTYLYPGFEEKLIGMKIQEKHEFELVMPPKMRVKELENKCLRFKVSILDIREKISKE